MSHLKDQLSGFGALSTEAVVEMLSSLDDRATAIVSTSLLENVLGIAIAYKFGRFPSDSEFGKLFTGYGPLATLSARIALAYNLKVISGDAHHDLIVIKGIRNAFAHTYLPMSFNSQKMGQECAKLKLTTTFHRPLADKLAADNRGKFIKSVFKNMIFLTSGMVLARHEKALLKEHSKELHDKTIQSLENRDYSFD
jgi:hypothetical protein